MEPNLQLAKKLNVLAWFLSVVVLALVGLMRQVKIQVPFDFGMLPAFHAILNGLSAVFLISAYIHIRNRRIEKHKRSIYVAVGLSALFLLSYVVYHFTTPETLFGDWNKDGILSAEELSGVGSQRTIYLVLLISHIMLAAFIFPFILFTFIRAYTGQYDRHKRMARWVFPVWLYVAVTGPIVYLMLRPYY